MIPLLNKVQLDQYIGRILKYGFDGLEGASKSEMKQVINYLGDELLKSEREKIQNIDPSVTGFNIGINSGISSGQTIFHVHIHLIPRRDNDIKDPRGGVRGVIPDKKLY